MAAAAASRRKVARQAAHIHTLARLHLEFRVVGVGPGAVATPINEVLMANPEALKLLNAAIPLGHMAQPESIARAVAFLASDEADYITATTLFVDGGIMQQGPGL